jgi:hypothetical protein
MNIEVKIGPEAIAEAEACEQALAAAKSLVVATSADYVNAGEELKRLAAREKQIEGMRVQMKAPALETCRRIDEFFRQPLRMLADSKAAIKKALGTYDAEQRRLREEAERVAAEAARAERARQEAEAAKIEEAARLEREEEEAKAREIEAAGQAELAEVLRNKAKEEEAVKRARADALRQAAASIPVAPVVHVEQPAVEGISSRKVWKFLIEDASLLPREFTMPNETAIGGVVRAMKDKTNIPGVIVYAEDVYSARSA